MGLEVALDVLGDFWGVAVVPELDVVKLEGFLEVAYLGCRLAGSVDQRHELRVPDFRVRFPGIPRGLAVRVDRCFDGSLMAYKGDGLEEVPGIVLVKPAVRHLVRDGLELLIDLLRDFLLASQVMGQRLPTPYLGSTSATASRTASWVFTVTTLI